MVMLNYQHLNTDVYIHIWLLIIIYQYPSELWKFTLSADTRWRKSGLSTPIIRLALKGHEIWIELTVDQNFQAWVRRDCAPG